MANKTPMTASSSNENPLYVGQLNVPPKDKVLEAFNGIFDRQFYTNHGPLVAEFERALSEYLGVRHVICMTNGTVALMVALKAIGARGDAVVPAFTFPATVQALSYAGLTPVFCDVDPQTHNATPETVRRALTPRTQVILPVHLWGRACDIDGLQDVANETGTSLVFDAAHALGCTYKGRTIGEFGKFEAFSFHATKILNCTEGGCVTTNDDAVADAIRTVRNFHEQQTFVDVSLRVNAKMSEAQAAMGLISLAELSDRISQNKERYHLYRERLSAVSGLHFIDHAGSEASNYQYVVLQVDAEGFGLDRDILVRYLAENGILARRYFYPGMHHAHPYEDRTWRLPITDRLCESIMQVPSGAMISEADIDRVCNAIRCAQRDAPTIRVRLADKTGG